ncbi:MAG: histidine phosphatase family protein [Bacillota bacterium]
MKVSRLLLIRHGETVWNSEGLIQGHMDIDLSEAGLAQADGLASSLRKLEVAACYSSDLGRAFNTARPFAAVKGLRAIRLPSLRELCFGGWQGRAMAEIIRTEAAAYQAYSHPDGHGAPPGGESFQELRERVGRALRSLARQHAGETIAVFGHGGTIRGGLIDLLQLPNVARYSFRPDNCGVTVLEHAGQWWRLIAYNCRVPFGELF